MVRQEHGAVDGEEFDDSPKPLRDTIPVVDASQLHNPVVLAAIGFTAVGLAALAWPVRDALWPDRLLGIGVIAAAVVWVMGNRTLRRLPRTAVGLAAVAVGWFVALPPRALSESSGELHDLITVVVALACVGFSGAVVVASLDARNAGAVSYAGVGRLLERWLWGRPKSVSSRRDLRAKVLYEGPTGASRVGRFLVLMGLASAVASLGVIADSTAAVIAAMLIAPLMIPIMGMALSIVMGWPRRLARTAVLAVAGVAVAVAGGLLMALSRPEVVDLAANSQITSRVTPTSRDLLIALAAGAAGAYGLSRPDVSDSLPGAAVAISLVPPLSVAGVASSQGDWGATTGALLLFATNALAILTVGGLTFVLTGIAPIDKVRDGFRRTRTWLVALGVACAVVGVALLVNGANLGSIAFEQDRIDRAVDEWLSDALHHHLDITTDGDAVAVVVVGPADDRPDVSLLADALSTELGRSVAVDVRFLVEDRVSVEGS